MGDRLVGSQLLAQCNICIIQRNGLIRFYSAPAIAALTAVSLKLPSDHLI